MRAGRGTGPVRAALLLACCLAPVAAGCGEGWDAYEPFYQNQPEKPGAPWSGPERVFVGLGPDRVETPLEGIETVGFRSSAGIEIASVRLSDLIEISEITEAPEPYRYDFTATDGYNLLRKRSGDLLLLPDWEVMHYGYLYRSELGDLTVGWDEAKQPWGSAVSAYNLKYMDGGLITLLEP